MAKDFPLVIKRGRKDLGFPDWRMVCDWLDEDGLAPVPVEEVLQPSTVKNPEIAVLPNYEELPEDCFWDNWPEKDLPKEAETSVDIKAFEKEVPVDSVKDLMTASELKRAKKVM